MSNSLYRFPEAYSVRDESIEWQGCKLAEETGEVCQAIVKGTRQQVIAECVDVIQVCENILRACDCTEGMLRDAFNAHLVYCSDRGYYVDEEALF